MQSYPGFPGGGRSLWAELSRLPREEEVSRAEESWVILSYFTSGVLGYSGPLLPKFLLSLSIRWSSFSLSRLAGSQRPLIFFTF